MAITLNTGKALALIHSHANSFVLTGDLWYASVFVDNGNASFAGVMQTFLGSCTLVLDAGQALAVLSIITKAKIVGLDMLALMDHVSLVNELEPAGDMPMSLLASKAFTSPNVWTRAAHCSATLSATPCSRASKVPTQARGSTVADVPGSTEAHPRFCDDHVLDGGAVSVPSISLSSSPSAPSIQTVLGYPCDRCGISCELSPGRSHGLNH